MRLESDSLGEIEVPHDRYWGAQTQRSLKYFSIGTELMPLEIIHAYGLLKRAAAEVNAELGLLPDDKCELIVAAAEEVDRGELDAHFPLHVWMTGSGTQTNMNVNEVIANRAIEMAGGVMGSKDPIHPNDHVNMSQSSNDTFPSVMNMAAAINTTGRLLPGVRELRDALDVKAKAWERIIKIGRTHMQDATPLTLGQEFSGYVRMLDEGIARIEHALKDVYFLALGGTAVGTGINAPAGFAEQAAERIAVLTGLPFETAPNKFAVQGAHDALVMLHGAFKALAGSLYKIANDIRLLSCGPRCGFNELVIPANEPGSSIMPGKVNPTQCEALAMIAVQVMGNDVTVGLSGAGGLLEMNVYKPVMINAVLQSIRILGDGAANFAAFLVEGTEPNEKQIARFVENSLMLVTALSPVIGYDKASHAAHHAYEHDLSLRQACLDLGYVNEVEFDRIVDPAKMVHPGL
ncbi:class II fumarate hydratase [Roseibium aggregatum]|uniref:Fumarate hydratase class II n=1 Tax=Roseibium aggregatum TaxID=187304 RepID=A0A926S750_9HYPH|nr:class II fumarate hydratase [Roseibium aggregatum]MBD1547162.1 class II fumarate hydratase [Roseibium aggregatum]